MLLVFLGSTSMAIAPNIVVFAILRTLTAIGAGGGQIGIITHGEHSGQQYTLISEDINTYIDQPAMDTGSHDAHMWN